MRLIKTDDGMIGLDYNIGKVIWCTSVDMAVKNMFGQFGHKNPRLTIQDLHMDVSIALNECTKHKHDIAEFGVLGGFMFTTKEENNEF